jgi:hypothetical protein
VVDGSYIPRFVAFDMKGKLTLVSVFGDALAKIKKESDSAVAVNLQRR